jgi:hypothetical protein
LERFDDGIYVGSIVIHGNKETEIAENPWSGQVDLTAVN